jgi:hypothetical protein
MKRDAWYLQLLYLSMFYLPPGAVVGYGVYRLAGRKKLPGVVAAIMTPVILVTISTVKGNRETRALQACLDERCTKYPAECTRGGSAWHPKPNTEAARCYEATHPRGFLAKWI